MPQQCVKVCLGSFSVTSCRVLVHTSVGKPLCIRAKEDCPAALWRKEKRVKKVKLRTGTVVLFFKFFLTFKKN